MKKILSLISAMFIALCTLTSCDEDAIIGSTLEGTWSGKMATYYDFNGYTKSVTSTEIEFATDPTRYKSGYGYWIDHFSNRRGDYYYSRISWRVIDSRIIINFASQNSEIEIYDYHLSGKHFTGWFKDGYNTNTEFDLVKIDGPGYHYDSDYGWGDYYDDYYYGYAKTTRSGSDSTTVKNMVPVRRFNK